MWKCSLVSSLLVHLVVVFAITRGQVVDPPTAPRSEEKPPLVLRLQTPPPPPIAVAQPVVRGKAAREVPKTKKPKAAAPARPRAYQDLVREFAGEGGQLAQPADLRQQGGRLSERLSGKEGQQADLAMGELAFTIVVPYAYRKMAKEGKAYARLYVRRQPRRHLWLDTLAGDPYLRAALYAVLRHQENQERLLQLFAQLGYDVNEESLTVVLTFAMRYGQAVGHNLHDTSWRLEGNHLYIQQLTFDAPAEGMMLPDDQVERDNAWDRLKLDALRDSPAFKRPLYRRGLTEP